MVKFVVDSAVFKTTLEHPSHIERGGAVRFRAQFEHVKDGLADPTGLTAKLYDHGETLVATLTATKESQGVYYADYTVSATQATGPHLVEWQGTNNSLTLRARAGFKIVKTVM